MNLTLTELKIAHDVAKALLDTASGSKIGNPDKFNLASHRYEKIKAILQDEAIKFIDNLNDPRPKQLPDK